MSDPDPYVRRARPGDAEAVARLWIALQEAQGRVHEAFAPSEDAATRWANDFRAWVGAEEVRRILVAERNGRIAGFATAETWYPAPIYRPGREVFLTALYVAPDDRRRGLGGALVAAVRAWAATIGAERIRLDVVAGNPDADAFWTALGAEPLSRRLGLDV